MNESIRINYASIVSSIGKQFEHIVKDGTYASELTGIKNLFIEDEQTFLKRTEYVYGSIYIVIHFDNSALDIVTSMCSVALRILGTEGAVEPARALLAIFSSKYNYQYMVTDYPSGSATPTINQNIIQTWRAPVITSNFVEAAGEFRNLFVLTGVYYVTLTSSTTKTLDLLPEGIQYIYGSTSADVEIIQFLSYNDNLNISLEPQTFAEKDGYTDAVARMGTFTFAMTIYPTNSNLMLKLIKMKGFLGSGETRLNPNQTFRFSLTMTDGTNNYVKTSNYKLSSMDFRKSQRNEISMISLTFTESADS